MEKRRVPYRRVGAPDPQHRADGVLDEAYGVVESVSVSGASLHRHYVREYVDEAHDQREHDAAHHVRAERRSFEELQPPGHDERMDSASEHGPEREQVSDDGDGHDPRHW